MNGASGKGKSTLFKLLLQQLEPKKGTILIDGDNIKQYNTDNLFSYLRQQGYMFDTSIKENILLGKEESDNFKEIIEQLNIDLTKNINDLSGGEKQKIAIARLLVNPNPIILLDESFSNIDIASSKMILNSLSKLENTMVIMITHRKQELEDIEYDSIDIFK